MSDIPTDPAPQGGVDSGTLAHALVGISAVVLSGLMYTRPRGQDLFFDPGDCCSGQCDVLHLEAFSLGNGSLVSDGAGNGCHSGFYGMAVGYTLVYVTLWIAFIHCVIGGAQVMR